MKTYLNITITHYTDTGRTSVFYYRHEEPRPAISTCDKLTADEANQLMWELVKLGGKNYYHSNMFNPAICTREVEFFGEL